MLKVNREIFVRKTKEFAAITDSNKAILIATDSNIMAKAETVAEALEQLMDLRGFSAPEFPGQFNNLHVFATDLPSKEDIDALADFGITSAPEPVYVDRDITETSPAAKSDGFMKFDDDKIMLELVPPSAIDAMGAVLTMGAKKYAKDNWRNVDDISRYVGAAMRHLNQYRDGEFLDSESGLPHLAHCMTNLAFLLELDKDEEV